MCMCMCETKQKTLEFFIPESYIKENCIEPPKYTRTLLLSGIWQNQGMASVNSVSKQQNLVLEDYSLPPSLLAHRHETQTRTKGISYTTKIASGT